MNTQINSPGWRAPSSIVQRAGTRSVPALLLLLPGLLKASKQQLCQLPDEEIDMKATRFVPAAFCHLPVLTALHYQSGHPSLARRGEHSCFSYVSRRHQNTCRSRRAGRQSISPCSSHCSSLPSAGCSTDHRHSLCHITADLQTQKLQKQILPLGGCSAAWFKPDKALQLVSTHVHLSSPSLLPGSKTIKQRSPQRGCHKHCTVLCAPCKLSLNSAPTSAPEFYNLLPLQEATVMLNVARATVACVNNFLMVQQLFMK